MSRADAPAVTIGERIIDNPGQVPIAFEIEYDPEEIDERFTYAVQVRIMEGEKLAFINDTVYSVITRDNPTHVDMVLVKVGATPTEPTPSEPAMVEVLAPIESVNVVVSESAPTEYTLQIVSGLPGGCVEFKGYVKSREGNTLTIGVVNLEPAAPVPCTAIYSRHEGEVVLGDNLTPGETYAVVVNGEVTNSFLARDERTIGWVTETSPIETVEVAVSDSEPPLYSLNVVSRLPKGSSCSVFNGYDIVRRFAGRIEVTVTHLAVAPGEVVPCTADFPVASTEIPLGTELVAGETYAVVVNGEVTNSFLARDERTTGWVVETSPIESVEVVVSDSEPPRYSLNVISRLPRGSSCSAFNGYDISRPFANTIHVRVTHLEVAGQNVPCTRDLPVVATEIPLGINFVADEQHSVIVNGKIMETFTAKATTIPAPVAFEVGPCRMTRAAQLPIEFEYKGTVPTGFDGINRANCTFTKPVETVTVTLTGPATHTEVFTLGEPSTDVSFPLPEGTLSISTLEIVPPGEYEREMTVTSVDGETLVVSDQPGVLKTVTVLEPVAFEIGSCAMTLAAQLPIEFEYKGTVPTGFDGINRANCTFTKEVKTVAVTLTGPATHTEVFTLSEPSTQVSFPLPEGTLSISTLEIVQPGDYEREISVTSVDGETLVISDQPGVLKTVTVLEPVAFEIGPCAMTLAAQLPIEFEYKGTVPTGFDGINRANCTFTKLVETVTVTLTGPASHTEAEVVSFV